MDTIFMSGDALVKLVSKYKWDDITSITDAYDTVIIPSIAFYDVSRNYRFPSRKKGIDPGSISAHKERFTRALELSGKYVYVSMNKDDAERAAAIYIRTFGIAGVDPIITRACFVAGMMRNRGIPVILTNDPSYNYFDGIEKIRH